MVSGPVSQEQVAFPSYEPDVIVPNAVSSWAAHLIRSHLLSRSNLYLSLVLTFRVSSGFAHRQERGLNSPGHDREF